MKRKIIFLSIISVFIMIIILIYVLVVSPSAKQKNNYYDDQTKYLVHQQPEKVFSLIKEKKEGIYYFGFPTCPWCQELLPVLNQQLYDNSFMAYSINVRASNFTKRDKKELTEIFIKSTNEKSPSVPFILAINKKGEIMTHVGTVPGNNAEVEKLTSSQTTKLKKEIHQIIWFVRNS